MYVKSVDDTVENYTGLLRQLNTGKLGLPNRDCDTGRETVGGEYALTDKTYACLIDRLASQNSDPVSPELRENIERFYSDPNAPIATKKNAKAWRKLQDELTKLKGRAMQPSAEPRVRDQ